MRLTLQEACQLLKGQLVVAPSTPGQVIGHLTWDSRQVQPGGAFLAIAGEQADGNDYLSAALQAGAALLIASRPVDSGLQAAAAAQGACLVKVDDPEYALGEIARHWRHQLAARVVGVTGSSGKTSTKELVAAVLAMRYSTQANPGNYNNLLGLPATILGCEPETELLVLEMGMQHKGEIARYCEIAAPEMAVYTNIGVAHLEHLGSQQAIAEAKSELLSALPDGRGLAVLNANDPFSAELLRLGAVSDRGIEVVAYGRQAAPGEDADKHFGPSAGLPADVWASDIKFDAQGLPSFNLHLAGGERLALKLQLPGAHSVSNALAAAALGERLGISGTAIAAALASASPPALRQQTVELKGGTRVINDSYNANRDSMLAALAALAAMDASRPHIAVLGDMFELGPDEEAMHRQVGQAAAQSGLSLLVAVGSRARWIAEAAEATGMHPVRTGDGTVSQDTVPFPVSSPVSPPPPVTAADTVPPPVSSPVSPPPPVTAADTVPSPVSPSRVVHVTDWQQAVDILVRECARQPIILVKASRSMALERIVEALQDEL